jgi:putative ABC transport system permease protein
VLAAWLRRLVGASLADAIEGDLEEERRRRATRSRAGAALWLWIAAIGILLHVGWGRLRESLQQFSAEGLGPGARGEWRRTLRSLARVPWFSCTAVGLLALTLTLAVTAFAIVDGALFTPLRYPAPDRLFLIHPGFTRVAPRADQSEPMSVADVDAWMAADPKTRITIYQASNTTTLGDGINEPLVGLAAVGPDFFDVLGVHPILGGFAPVDFQSRGSFQPLIISDALWQGRFAGDPAVVGRRVVVNSVDNIGYRIVGVMPPGFVFPADRVPVDVISPVVIDPAAAGNPRVRSMSFALARLGPGATAASLRAQVEAGMAEVARTFPPPGPRPARMSEASWVREGPFDRVDVVPLEGDLGRRDRPLLVAVFWASVVLVVLAALNVSGLLAARVLDRSHEFSLRRALGATPARLARLVLIEALTLTAAAATIAVVASGPFLRVVMVLLPETLVLFKTPAIDWRAIGLAAMAAVVLAVAATAWPIVRALRSGRTPPATDLGRATARVRSLGRTLLLASQTAGALVLTVGGALVVGSILRVYADAPPLQTDHVAVIEVWSYGSGQRMNTTSPERVAGIAGALERLRQVPGVTAVAADSAQILAGGDSWYVFEAPGASNDRLVTYAHGVTADFYRTVGLSVVAGRLPTEAEARTRAPVLLVSESVARTYWPDGAAVGQTLVDQASHTAYTIVGVCPDVQWISWDERAPAVYGPFAQISRYPWTSIFLRIQGDDRAVTAQALQAIGETDPMLRPRTSSTLDALFVDSVRARRFRAWLFGSFAVAALVIIGVGVLGLLAMTTARRTREVGIRMALGATSDGVVRLFLGEQLPGVAAGLAVGGLVAAWAVRFLSAYVYQLTIYDVRVWAVAITLILGVAAAGAIVPARKAGRVDPVRALRAE